MAPKLDIVYSRGRAKSVAPSRLMIGTFYDERDLEYVTPNTLTPTPSSRYT